MHEKIAAAYFDGWRRRDIDAIAAALHADVTFSGPTARLEGRSAVLAAFRTLLPMPQALETRHLAVSGDRAMAVYDFVCGEPVGRIPMAELIGFRDGLITSIEMFFDPRCLLAPEGHAAG